MKAIIFPKIFIIKYFKETAPCIYQYIYLIIVLKGIRLYDIFKCSRKFFIFHVFRLNPTLPNVALNKVKFKSIIIYKRNNNQSVILKIFFLISPPHSLHYLLIIYLFYSFVNIMHNPTLFFNNNRIRH
jgi:hypothetical protein